MAVSTATRDHCDSSEHGFWKVTGLRGKAVNPDDVGALPPLATYQLCALSRGSPSAVGDPPAGLPGSH